MGEEVGYSTMSTAAAWLSGLRNEFRAALSTHKGSNMYLSSSEDCGIADRLRLQVTLKFH